MSAGEWLDGMLGMAAGYEPAWGGEEPERYEEVDEYDPVLRCHCRL